jgi:hypothetical protein
VIIKTHGQNLVGEVMKPKTKEDSFLQAKLVELDNNPILEDQFKRQQRRQLKKLRKKHLRNEAKSTLREILDETA